MLKRPIAIGLSPNTEKDDILLALKILFSPWQWRRQEEVKKLEKKFAEQFGKEYQAFAVNSGRGAEYLILKALGVKKGDEVAIQAFTCTVVANAILKLKAKPIYIDIDSSYNMNPRDLAQKITPKTKAIIVQHTFGLPADLAAIKKIAQEKKIPLIEDCCHSLGATYRGQLIGSFGEAAFFSFGRDKVLSSVFGGIILCRQKALAQKIEKLRNQLPLPSFFWTAQQLLHPPLFALILPFYNHLIGKALLVFLQKLHLLSKAVSYQEKLGRQPKIFPQKMPGGLAILAQNQLKKLKRFNKHRKQMAQIYFQNLKNLNLNLPPQIPGASWLRFPIHHPQAQKLYQYAKKRGILLGNWYQDIVMPAKNLATVNYKLGSCPKAEKLSSNTINLPTYPCLTTKEALKVVQVIKQWLNTKAEK